MSRVLSIHRYLMAAVLLIDLNTDALTCKHITNKVLEVFSPEQKVKTSAGHATTYASGL